MEMLIPPSIRDYYEEATKRLRQEVDSTPDDQAVGMDPEDWTAYFIKRYAMELIRLDDTRSERMVETSTNYGPAVRVEVPVIPSDTLRIIVKDGLAGEPIWMIDYKEFLYSHADGIMCLTAAQHQNEVENARKRIRDYIQSLNTAIESANKTFPNEV